MLNILPMHLTYTNNLACAYTHNHIYTLHAPNPNSISSHSFSIVCSVWRFPSHYSSICTILLCSSCGGSKTLSCVRLLCSLYIWLLLWMSLVTANEQLNQFSTRSISKRLGLCASLLSFFVFRRPLNIIGTQKVFKFQPKHRKSARVSSEIL